MRASVLAAFPALTDSLEGFTLWCYNDVKRLKTVGRGDLVEPLSVFQRVPWKLRGTGAIASPQDVLDGWNALEAAPGARLAAWYAGVTDLCLTKQDVDDLSFAKLHEMWGIMAGRFPNLESLCADAQLALCSLSWADGPEFRYPRFEAALAIEDFARYLPDGKTFVPGCCAAECGISEVGNPGVAPRNVRQRALFASAQRVVDQSLDPDVIHGWGAQAVAQAPDNPTGTLEDADGTAPAKA